MPFQPCSPHTGSNLQSKSLPAAIEMDIHVLLRILFFFFFKCKLTHKTCFVPLQAKAAEYMPGHHISVHLICLELLFFS